MTTDLDHECDRSRAVSQGNPLSRVIQELTIMRDFNCKWRCGGGWRHGQLRPHTAPTVRGNPVYMRGGGPLGSTVRSKWCARTDVIGVA